MLDFIFNFYKNLLKENIIDDNISSLINNDSFLPNESDLEEKEGVLDEIEEVLEEIESIKEEYIEKIEKRQQTLNNKKNQVLNEIKNRKQILSDHNYIIPDFYAEKYLTPDVVQTFIDDIKREIEELKKFPSSKKAGEATEDWMKSVIDFVEKYKNNYDFCLHNLNELKDLLNKYLEPEKTLSILLSIFDCLYDYWFKSEFRRKEEEEERKRFKPRIKDIFREKVSYFIENAIRNKIDTKEKYHIYHLTELKEEIGKLNEIIEITKQAECMKQKYIEKIDNIKQKFTNDYIVFEDEDLMSEKIDACIESLEKEMKELQNFPQSTKEEKIECYMKRVVEFVENHKNDYVFSLNNLYELKDTVNTCCKPNLHTYKYVFKAFFDLENSLIKDINHELSIKSKIAKFYTMPLKARLIIKKIKQAEESFYKEQNSYNKEVELIQKHYEEGNEKYLLKMAGLVLSKSHKKIYNPKVFKFTKNNNYFNVKTDYEEKNSTLIAEISLPTADMFFQEELIKAKLLKKREFSKLYDSVLSQIVLVFIDNLYKFDYKKHIKNIVLNGFVEGFSKSTGQKINNCIVSVSITRERFEEINLNQVDAIECLKFLKARISSEFINIAPVNPILEFDKNDKRFISAENIIDTFENSTNLATMDWDKFEYLVRDLFGKMFSEHGGDVKITQASRDKGVDAVVFDPDPIRGGKFIIQCKRYNNVVGVSDVRDLWGTVMHEGASKGILVTTSHFGMDSIEWVKDKPITLINGQNLLSLFQKHGYDFKIELVK